MKNTFFPVFLLCLVLPACRQEPEGFKELDLNPFGLPFSILAPDSAEVIPKDYGVMRDITVRKGEDFFIQIFEFEAPRTDAAGEKLRQLQTVREDPFFHEVIREDEHGFIYATRPDSLQTYYDFRHIRMAGTKELIFQTGLVGRFSLEEVKKMYKAVK